MASIVNLNQSIVLCDATSRATPIPWPYETRTDLIHATATDAACAMLDWDASAKCIVITLKPRFSKDFGLPLVWFGVPGAMTEEALEYFGHRYGNVQFVVDPGELAEFRTAGLLEGRKYKQELSCPLHVVARPARNAERPERPERPTFDKGTISFQWPVGHDRVNAEVAVESESAVTVRIKKIEFVPHSSGTICVPRVNRRPCFDSDKNVNATRSHAIVLRALLRLPCKNISDVMGSPLPGLTESDMDDITGNRGIEFLTLSNLSDAYFADTMKITCHSCATSQEVASLLLLAAYLFVLPPDWEEQYDAWVQRHRDNAPSSGCQLKFDTDRVKGEMKRLQGLACWSPA